MRCAQNLSALVVSFNKILQILKVMRNLNFEDLQKVSLILEIQQLDNCDDLEKGFVESAFPLNLASMELKCEP